MKSPIRSPAAAKGRGREFERHSGSGLRGLPKKKGAGGKTVWGAEMDQAPVTCLDKHDPNYDSDNDVDVSPPHLDLNPSSSANVAAHPAQLGAPLEKQGDAESPAESSASVDSSPDAGSLPAPGTSV